MREAFYQSRQPGQKASILTRPAVGLNEYSPPASLNENYMSDLLDVGPFRNEGLEFSVDQTISQLCATQGIDMGSVRAVIPSSASTDALFIFYLMAYTAANRLIHKLSSSPAITTYTVTPKTAGSTIASYRTAGVTFNTESTTYQCFISSQDDRLHFIKIVGSVESYGYVDLPFFPAQMVVHANRIFIIDTKNILWWCRGGDLYSWYSVEYDDDAIFTVVNMKGTAYTVTNQPNQIRVLTFLHTVVDTADTVGTIAVVGTNSLDAVQTETVTPPAGTGRVQTLKMYKTITSLTPSGWTQVGAVPDTISCGWGPLGGYVQEDAGYWTMESESSLLDMCVLGDSIYMFAPHSIYWFSGFSYDTFSLKRINDDIGIQILASPDGYNCLSTVRNKAYFLYQNEVYEFDGNAPRIMSRPVMVNNALVNGTMGGIVLAGSDWVLSSDAYGLYVYSKSTTPALYYYFDIETRSWWKKSGVAKADVGTASTINIRYVPSHTKQSMFMFVTINGTTLDLLFSQQLGKVQTDQPYIITKVYNTNPSETGTLTDLILMLQGTLDDSADITVSYSLTDAADDFIAIKHYEEYIFTGDVEIFSVPVPVAYIANAHHYRLKISIAGAPTYPVYLYNIERRFRVKGRTR